MAGYKMVWFAPVGNPYIGLRLCFQHVRGFIFTDSLTVTTPNTTIYPQTGFWQCRPHIENNYVEISLQSERELPVVYYLS